MSDPRDVWIFDLDGTLLRSNGVDESCFEQAALEVLPDLADSGGVPTDWSTYPDATDVVIFGALMDRAGVPAVLRGHVMKVFRVRFLEMIEEAIDADPSLVEPAPGIEALLASIHGRAAVATGGFGATAAAKLRGAGLPSITAPIRCCDDAPTRVEIIGAAARAVGVDWDDETDRARVVYFGDGTWDRKACEEAGIRFIGVALEAEARARLQAAVARPVIESFEDASAVEAAVGEAGSVLAGV